MARINYGFQKHQREMKKQKKREEKDRRRLEKKQAANAVVESAPAGVAAV